MPGDTVYIIKNVDMVTGVGVGVKEAQCCVYYDSGGGVGACYCAGPRRSLRGRSKLRALA